MKRVLVGVLGVFSFCFSAVAQQTPVSSSALDFYRPEMLSTVDGSTLLHRLPVMAFLDGRHLPLSTPMGRMGMMPLELASSALSSNVTVQKTNVAQPDGKDSSSEVMNLQPNPIYYGGEVGFLYGHASGKFGGDLFETYMMGGVGTDKFQINVGASYEEWNSHVPHGRH
jgi:hypothetical protein